MRRRSATRRRSGSGNQSNAAGTTCWHWRRSNAASGRKLSSAALGVLDLPLLVVVGNEDETLASARQLAAVVSGAELVTLAGEDHQSTLAAEGYKQAVGRFFHARQERRVPQPGRRY